VAVPEGVGATQIPGPGMGAALDPPADAELPDTVVGARFVDPSDQTLLARSGSGVGRRGKAREKQSDGERREGGAKETAPSHGAYGAASLPVVREQDVRIL
jgi:hypothetical protein